MSSTGDPNQRRIRIVQCQWRWQGRGAEQLVVDLHRCFTELGHDSSAWAGYVSGSPPPEAVEVIDSRPPGAFRRAGLTAGLIRRLRGVDAVVCHSPAAVLHVGVAAAAARVPVRIAVHHLEPAMVGRLAMWSERWLGTIGVIHRNVYVSESLAEIATDHPRRYRDRMVVVPNGITVTNLSQTEARHRFGLRRSDRVVATAGALTDIKNHRVLIESAAQGGDWRLLIAGDGPARSELEAAASSLRDRVRFLGQISREDVGALFAAADVVAHPATWEAHPLAQLEALAGDRPVVASDIASSRATCGPAARYVPAQDATAWTRELERLLDDAAARDELATARLTIPVRSPDDVAADYLDVIESVCTEDRLRRRYAARSPSM